MTDGPTNSPTDVSYWGPPVEQPKKRRGKKVLLWVLAVVGVLVIGFGVLVALAVNDTKKQYDATASLTEGQCLNVTRMDTTNPGLVAADCTSTTANYLIGAKLPSTTASCPAGDYDIYHQGSRFSSDVTFCLVPVFAKGKCYLLTDAGTTQEPCKVTSEGSIIRIEQVLTNETSKKKCTKGNFALSYSKPATVFCATTLIPTGTSAAASS